mmetsp:Transcript_50078/g.79278  ORF Transcript_50078/g.79278 Transcript_50078/m.79278 type:complete len:172 (-) Transcript_50078:65-580(-)
MLGGGYDDSDSEEQGEGQVAGNAEEQTNACEAEEEESEEESDDDPAGGKRLPSAKKAFTLGEDSLEFKKFASAQARQQRVRAAESEKLDRVPAASAATLRSQNSAEKRPAETEANAETNESEAGKGGGKDKGKMSVKERTRIKRLKGQSGIDHNGKVWKPEVWMKIRQEFD